MVSNCRCTAIAITAKQAERYGITTTPPQVNPDPGWDYSVCHDGPGEGVRRAIRERQSGGDPLLDHPKVKKKLAELRAAVDRWQDLGRLLDETMERAGRRTEWRDLLRTFEQDARNLGTQPYHLASLRLYSGSDYGPINHLLRTLFSDEFYGDLLRLRTDSEIEVAALLIKAIDEAFERMPRQQGTFYRGLRILSDDLDRFLKAHKVGAVVFYAAYSSTSKVDYAAFSGNVRLIFEGASGIDLEPFSAFPGEKEVLLPRGGTFRVVEVVQKEGMWLIRLEEVPMSEKEKERIPPEQRFAEEPMSEVMKRFIEAHERWVKAGRPVTEGQRRFIERCTDETLTSLDVMEALKRQGKWPPKGE